MHTVVCLVFILPLLFSWVTAFVTKSCENVPSWETSYVVKAHKDYYMSFSIAGNLILCLHNDHDSFVDPPDGSSPNEDEVKFVYKKGEMGCVDDKSTLILTRNCILSNTDEVVIHVYQQHNRFLTFISAYKVVVDASFVALDLRLNVKGDTHITCDDWRLYSPGPQDPRACWAADGQEGARVSEETSEKISKGSVDVKLEPSTTSGPLTHGQAQERGFSVTIDGCALSTLSVGGEDMRSAASNVFISAGSFNLVDSDIFITDSCVSALMTDVENKKEPKYATSINMQGVKLHSVIDVRTKGAVNVVLKYISSSEPESNMTIKSDRSHDFGITGEYISVGNFDIVSDAVISLLFASPSSTNNPTSWTHHTSLAVTVVCDKTKKPKNVIQTNEEHGEAKSRTSDIYFSKTSSEYAMCVQITRVDLYSTSDKEGEAKSFGEYESDGKETHRGCNDIGISVEDRTQMFVSVFPDCDEGQDTPSTEEEGESSNIDHVDAPTFCTSTALFDISYDLVVVSSQDHVGSAVKVFGLSDYEPFSVWKGRNGPVAYQQLFFDVVYNSTVSHTENEHVNSTRRLEREAFQLPDINKVKASCFKYDKETNTATFKCHTKNTDGTEDEDTGYNLTSALLIVVPNAKLPYRFVVNGAQRLAVLGVNSEMLSIEVNNAKTTFYDMVKITEKLRIYDDPNTEMSETGDGNEDENLSTPLFKLFKPMWHILFNVVAEEIDVRTDNTVVQLLVHSSENTFGGTVESLNSHVSVLSNTYDVDHVLETIETFGEGTMKVVYTNSPRVHLIPTSCDNIPQTCESGSQDPTASPDASIVRYILHGYFKDHTSRVCVPVCVPKQLLFNLYDVEFYSSYDLVLSSRFLLNIIEKDPANKAVVPTIIEHGADTTDTIQLTESTNTTLSFSHIRAVGSEVGEFGNIFIDRVFDFSANKVTADSLDGSCYEFNVAELRLKSGNIFAQQGSAWCVVMFDDQTNLGLAISGVPALVSKQGDWDAIEDESVTLYDTTYTIGMPSKTLRITSFNSYVETTMNYESNYRSNILSACYIGIPVGVVVASVVVGLVSKFCFRTIVNVDEAYYTVTFDKSVTDLSKTVSDIEITDVHEEVVPNETNQEFSHSSSPF